MSILFDSQKKIFHLCAGSFSYGMRISERNTLCNLWYGAKLCRAEDFPDEEERMTRTRGIDKECSREIFAEYGGFSPESNGFETAVKAVLADGKRDLRLRYASHRIEGNVLTITLKDDVCAIEVVLTYRVLEDVGIIERGARLCNFGTEPITLEKFDSSELHLPYRDAYRLTTLTGKWGDEYRITRDFIRDGQTVLQTRNIMSGPDAVPFFAIDEGQADERIGGVWFGSLLWSGAHRLTVEKDWFGNIHVFAGVNPFDATVTLGRGEAWETPVFAFGYVESGFGDMSRAIHAYQRQHLMPPVERDRLMPVVCNAYGTYFANINEEKILSLIAPAQEVGVEAFILDAGWAGEGENYMQGMGDWQVNRERFPHGLKAISDELHRRGMLMGLWMEPECCHPDSRLAKEHPDWVFGDPVRGGDLVFRRLVLNFALDEVRDAVTEKIEQLVESCGVDYFKIDFNRFLFEVESERFSGAEKKSAWIRYVENLTRCYETIKRRHPNLLFENCASGGLRVDLSMTRFSGRINRSDNQDPLDILRLHEGFSYFMLPKFAGGGCHISDVYTRHFNGRITPMRYQAHIGMMGSLAIGKNLVQLSEEEKAELKQYIALYKEIRPVVQLGDIYRLASASDHPYAGFEYLSRDRSEGVVFLLGKSIQFMRYGENLRLDGLDDDTLYDVQDLGVRSGRALMKIGLPVRLCGDFDSLILRFRAVGRVEKQG